MLQNKQSTILNFFIFSFSFPLYLHLPQKNQSQPPIIFIRLILDSWLFFFWVFLVELAQLVLKYRNIQYNFVSAFYSFFLISWCQDPNFQPILMKINNTGSVSSSPSFEFDCFIYFCEQFTLDIFNNRALLISLSYINCCM